jgi:NAD(P)-dependent dehydrogenase (short-subunit alcohol dehydrogenase family)
MVKDKIVLVTGAGGGIGRDFALAFAAHGMPALRRSFFPLDRTQDVFTWDPL